jgi:lysophospholipase L1-like esterase
MPVPTSTPARTVELVALGDSTPAGFGVVRSYVDMYAEHVEADLGAAVEIHRWARNGQRAAELLAVLREDQALRDDIDRADVITIWTGFNDIYPAIGIEPKGGACGPWDELDMDCVRERVADLKTTIDAIVAELLTLLDPDDTLILFADVGNPLAEEWEDLGLLDELKGPVFEEWIGHIADACEGTGIHVVHSYRELNGPGGGAVAPELLQADGLHLNGDGHRILAEMHRQVGYGPLEP